MLSRFHLIPERYGRTDRQTNGRAIKMQYNTVDITFDRKHRNSDKSNINNQQKQTFKSIILYHFLGNAFARVCLSVYLSIYPEPDCFLRYRIS